MTRVRDYELYLVDVDEYLHLDVPADALAWALDAAIHELMVSINPGSRGMGRHARVPERGRQLVMDFLALKLTDDLHNTGMTWTESCERVGERLGPTGGAIKKARSRAKKLLNR